MKDKILGAYFVVFSFVIYFLYFVGYLNNFLALKMIILSLISGAIFLVLGLLILFNKITNLKLSKNALVLIIPLIMIIVAGDGKLSLELAKKRGNNLSFGSSNSSKVEEVEKPVEKVEEECEEVETFELNDKNYLPTLNNLYANMNQVEGSKIKIRGFTIKEGSFLTDGYFSIGKYCISCCTADAAVVGILVKDDIPNVEDNAWYEIYGTLKVTIDKYGRQTIVIIPSKVTPIAEENMYVY